MDSAPKTKPKKTAATATPNQLIVVLLTSIITILVMLMGFALYLSCERRPHSVFADHPELNSPRMGLNNRRTTSGIKNSKKTKTTVSDSAFQPRTGSNQMGTRIDPGLINNERSDSESFLEVSFPKTGTKIDNPVTIQGVLKDPQTSVGIRIKDASGRILAQTFAAAHTSGQQGQYYSFNKKVFYEKSSTGKGTVEVFEESARNAGAVSTVKIPVVFAVE